MNRISRSGMMLVVALAVALTAGSIASAKTKPKPKPKTVVTAVSCSLSLLDQVDASGVPVVMSADQGAQYGTVGCNKLLGHGVFANQFTTDDGGDFHGTFQQFSGAGSVHGTMVLAQGENTGPTPEAFAASNYAGTISVLGGTGVYQGVKGTGTMSCQSYDSLHIACTTKLKLKQKL